MCRFRLHGGTRRGRITCRTDTLSEVGLVFGIGRSKTRSQLVRAELEEGLDHLKQAATHAAEGVGATVGPRVHAAREVVTPAASRARNAAAGGIAVITPLAMAAAEGARQAGKQAGKSSRRMKRKNAKALRRAVGREERGMSRNRKLAGLLMIGVAAGAAGSMIMRRRRQREEEQWTTHESSTARSATDAARQMTENAKDRLHSATESAKETVKHATDAAKSTAERAVQAGSSAISSDSKTDAKTDGKSESKEPAADRVSTSDRLIADPAPQSSTIRPAGMAGAGNKAHGDPLGAQDRWPAG
jgi:type II secretory pathway pseudopilin PulG